MQPLCFHAVKITVRQSIGKKRSREMKASSGREKRFLLQSSLADKGGRREAGLGPAAEKRDYGEITPRENRKRKEIGKRGRRLPLGRAMPMNRSLRREIERQNKGEGPVKSVSKARGNEY